MSLQQDLINLAQFIVLQSATTSSEYRPLCFCSESAFDSIPSRFFRVMYFPNPNAHPNSTQDSSLQNLRTSTRCVDAWAAYSGCPVYVTPTRHEGVCFLNKQFPRSQFLLRASRSRISLDATFPSTINSSLSKFHVLCKFVAL